MLRLINDHGQKNLYLIHRISCFSAAQNFMDLILMYISLLRNNSMHTHSKLKGTVLYYNDKLSTKELHSL